MNLDSQDQRSALSLDYAASRLEAFGVGEEVRLRIRQLEAAGVGRKPQQIRELLERESVNDGLVDAARTVKALAGQVNTVMHAAGILVSLSHILERGEIVESLSLGAGNTGRDHDLITDRRIAEFKFIDRRPARNTLRQNVVLDRAL